MTTTLKPASTFAGVQAPIAQKDTLMCTWTWLKKFQEWEVKLQNGLDLIGQFTGTIASTATIEGHAGTVGTTVQNLSGIGVLSSLAISGVIPHPNIPGAQIGGIGGVVSDGPFAHEWINAIDAGGTPLFSQPDFSDLTGSAGAGQLPNPTTSTLGGVEANIPVTHEWINAINTSGVPQLSQPDFTDISGQIATTQMPTDGVTHTVTLAALTTLGTQGSITFTNGRATAIVDPT